MNTQLTKLIFKKYAKGEYSPRANALVRCFLFNDIFASTRDKELGKIWKESAEDLCTNKKTKDNTLDILHEYISQKDKQIHRRRLLFTVLRWAAIFIFPILSGILCWNYSSKQAIDRYEMQQLYVEDGHTATLKLSDGSMVKLNGGSIILYPKEFSPNRSRQIWLEGEAYLIVTHDESRPFHVNVDELDIRVLGTRFNVKAYRDEEEVTTTLEQGRVKVTSPTSSVVLNPNEQATYYRNRNRISVKNVIASNYNAWKEGQLIFEQAPLSNILSTLSHKYGVRFRTDSSIDLNRKYSVNFIASEQLDNILNVISAMSGNITFSRIGKNITVNQNRS